MDATPASIRTPDQRLRVFVSSTLRELESERRAAREAIESLHLAPVMFELGARPHPPRSLYRSYLAQSDVFVGIYGDSYGWVAPGETVSGLEDEYLLSAGLPRLLYVRSPGDREPRLRALLDRIRADDTTSYRSFTRPEELTALVSDDLAVLLAERFDASAPRAARVVDAVTSIPAPFGPLVGRDAEVRALQALLDEPQARIVTIVGPGGIGKSRVAIEIAEAVAATGREVVFVMLESLSTPEQVVPAIARSLGVRDSGEEPLEDAVTAALADRDTLLVVDNMEHVLAASVVLVRLVTAAPHLQILVTSRSPLRVRAERTFDLGPLAVPEQNADDADALAASGVEFFAQRARAVQRDFAVTARNVADVAGIVRAVDGVPLAIELAAARTRMMSAHEILARLDSALTLLVGGARDLPPRQQALRSTIEWSVNLLDPAGTTAFDAIAVFRGPFTLEAAEAVLGAELEVLVADALESLIDASLLHRYDRDGVLVFDTLAIVRAYARHRSAPDGPLEERWVAHYVEAARLAAGRMRGAEQVPALARLNAEAENLAAVIRHLLDTRQLATAAEFAWSMYMPLWIGGRLGLQRGWMAEVIDIAAREHLELDARTEAIALYYTRAVSFWQDPDLDVVPGLQRSVDLFVGAGDEGGAGLAGLSLGLAYLAQAPGPDVAAARTALEAGLARFRAVGDAWGEAMIQVTLGRLDMVTGDLTGAAVRFDASVRTTAEQGELLGMAIALHHRGWPRFLAGDLDGAEADFGDALDISLELGHDEGVGYGLDGLTGVAAARGDAEVAGLLIGAARRLRRRTGLVNAAAFVPYAAAVAALREADGGVLDDATRRGEEMSPAEVLSRVRG
jgi:predicted ATPase